MTAVDAGVATRLGYGAASLGNLFEELDDDRAHAVLEAAWDSGIRSFDTAPHYGLGLAERRLGAFLQTKPRAEFVVSTKVGRLLRPDPGGEKLDLAEGFHVRSNLRREWDFSATGIRASLAESLDRLGLDRVDAVYLHDPERHDLDAALTRALPALEQLRADGSVARIGVGSMVTEALERSIEAARLDVVMIAGRYTLLEQPAGVRVLPACRRRGIAVVVASVFNSGVLATDAPSRGDRYEYGRMPDEVWDRLQRIVAVARSHGVPLPALAVQFPFRDTVVSSVVIGGDEPGHVRRNAELLHVHVPSQVWEELRAEGLIG